MEWNRIGRTGMRFACVLSVIVAVSSALGAPEPDPGIAAKGHENPQALLRTYRSALVQKDWRSCFRCYDLKMRGKFLMELFYAIGVTRDGELAAIAKRRLRVEFTDPASIPIPGLRRDNRVPDELLWYDALQKRVDDLPGFVEELCRRVEAMGQGAFYEIGEVANINIQGDRATGQWARPRALPVAPTLGGNAATIPIGDNAPAHDAHIPAGAGQPSAASLPEGQDRLEAADSVQIHFRKIGVNWYMTFPDPPPPLSEAERVKRLQADVGSLWIVLTCSSKAIIAHDGPNGVVTGKRYCELRMSVQPFVYRSNDPYVHLVRLTEEQAKGLIDHLGAEGFLQQAVELGKQEVPQRDLSENCYNLQISTQHQQLHADLGWGPEMLKRLDRLRAGLDGDAAKAMDSLLAGLSEERAKWGVKPSKPNRE